MGKLETINEWADLTAAIEHVQEDFDIGEDCLGTIVEQVPRLLEAYEQLFELSQQMTAAWESYNANQTIKPATMAEMKQFLG